jgi:hypothetical protein
VTLLVHQALGLVVAGLLTVAVMLVGRMARDHPGLVARSERAEAAARALDATLAITRTGYDAERQMWATALAETERTAR